MKQITISTRDIGKFVRFQYEEGVGNFICLVISCFFYSYDYRKENNLPNFYKEVGWEYFYKLLEDNLGKDEITLDCCFF